MGILFYSFPNQGEGGQKRREGRAEAMGGQEGRRASNHELDESHKESLALLCEDSDNVNTK